MKEGSQHSFGGFVISHVVVLQASPFLAWATPAATMCRATWGLTKLGTASPERGMDHHCQPHNVDLPLPGTSQGRPGSHTARISKEHPSWDTSAGGVSKKLLTLPHAESGVHEQTPVPALHDEVSRLQTPERYSFSRQRYLEETRDCRPSRRAEGLVRWSQLDLKVALLPAGVDRFLRHALISRGSRVLRILAAEKASLSVDRLHVSDGDAREEAPAVVHTADWTIGPLCFLSNVSADLLEFF